MAASSHMCEAGVNGSILFGGQAPDFCKAQRDNFNCSRHFIN